jgi:hypothetical protein
MRSPTLSDLLNLLQQNGILPDTSLKDCLIVLGTPPPTLPYSAILRLRQRGEPEHYWTFNGTEWILREGSSPSGYRMPSAR